MSDFLAAMHDPCPVELFAGKPGWCINSISLTTESIGSWKPRIRSQFDAGITPIVRLNYSYHPDGTIPTPDKYDMFADACGNFVQHFPYVKRWIIGNEPNLKIERPQGQVITPELYAQCFNISQAVIKTVDSNHEVIMGAVGLWNIETGDWLVYQWRVLELTDPGGIAIHTYSRGHTLDAIHSEEKMQSHPDRYVSFKAYRDLMNAIPDNRRHLPVYLTETNPNEEWADENRGWIQAAIGEIDWWNRQPGNQRIHCVATYRYERHDDKWMEGKANLLRDFRLAADFGLPSFIGESRVPTPTTPEESPEVDEGTNPLPARQWDPRLDQRGAKLVEAEPEPGTRYLRLVKAEWFNKAESGGRHHVFVRVLDENGNNVEGVTFNFVNGGVESKATGPATGFAGYALNFAMWNAGHPYSIIPVGIKGDVMRRLGLGSIDQPHHTIHTCYGLVWQWTIAPEADSGDETHTVYLPSVHGGGDDSGPVSGSEGESEDDMVNGKVVPLLARLMAVDELVLRAVLQIESGGRGFVDGHKLILRFEPAQFWRLWGRNNPTRFAEHFRGGLTWQGHDDEYRIGSDKDWHPIHGSQQHERNALELATILDHDTALQCASYGAAQIMGWHYELLGYDTPKQMVDSFKVHETNQLLGFAMFLVAKNLLEPLRREDFVTFATTYNGAGQAERYAALLEATLARLRGET